MPVYLDRPLASHELLHTNGSLRRSPVQFAESNARCLDIGLINNMPDRALHATERQFISLLDAAADGIVVRLSLFALADVPRGDSGRSHLGRFYSSVESLWNRQLDGLIVTGTEPHTSNLADEPYWNSLVKVLEWADCSTHSTVLSCLSAHAGLLHFDGIVRRRLAEKCFGVFECTRESQHPLTAGAPSEFPMPQSRWNEIPENELAARGYLVLSRSRDAGVDILARQRQSLFVFFQGHPEYEADTLFLEYRRDVGRYLRRERDICPSVPRGYFDTATAHALRAFQERVLHDRREEAFADFPAVYAGKSLEVSWSRAAVSIYGNWLAYLCAQKERRQSRCDIRVNMLGSGVGL